MTLDEQISIIHVSVGFYQREARGAMANACDKKKLAEINLRLAQLKRDLEKLHGQ